MATLPCDRSVSLAEQVDRGFVNLAERRSETTAVVCNSIKKQQPRVGERIQVRDLSLRLREEIDLSDALIDQLIREHGAEHLCDALSYVSERRATGRIRQKKVAGYYLGVVRNARPGSLSKPDQDAALAADGLVDSPVRQAARDEKRRNFDAAKAHFDSLPETDQAATYANYLADLAAENPIIYAGLKRKPLLQGTVGYQLLIQWYVDKVLRQRSVLGEGRNE